MDIPTVVLSDENGRSLLCYIEHEMQIDGQFYALLMPVHTPINLFVWEHDEEDEPILIDDEIKIADLFATAQAVLAEQNLTLQWSAVTLTVEGDVPDLEEDDDGFEFNAEDFNGSDHEEFQLLTRFYYQEQEYGVYIPVDPLLILTRLEQGQPKLLDTAEFERIEPILEARLAEELDP